MPYITRNTLFLFVLLCCVGMGCNEKKATQQNEMQQDDTQQEPPEFNELTLARGDLSFSVVVPIGGRISSFKWKEVEFLKTERDSAHLQWGSTIWPGPQSEWGWPPPAGMDKGPYEVVSYVMDEVVLKSKVNDYRGIEVEKKIRLNEARAGLDITYTFTNTGNDTLPVGIWENSRVTYEGTIYWKSETTQKLESLSIDEHPGDKYKQFVKDGTGWLGYVKGGYIWIKAMQMPNESKVAPEQAPIEIYLDRADGFAEIEDHGPFQLLAPGEKMSFEVKWTIFNPGGEEVEDVLRQVYE